MSNKESLLQMREAEVIALREYYKATRTAIIQLEAKLGKLVPMLDEEQKEALRTLLEEK